MTKNSRFCALLMSVICLIASCVSTDDSTTIATSDQAAITSFVLGTFKVGSTSYTGSDYTVNIDQIGQKVGEIYNTDSLPKGASLKMLATVNSLNYGSIYYQKWSDNVDSLNTWNVYSSTDSINFADTLRFIVVSSDLTNIRYYRTKINVHTEFEDSFQWDTLAVCGNFKDATILKGRATSEAIYVLTDKGLYVSGNLGENWSPLYAAANCGEAWQDVQSTNKTPIIGNDIVSFDNDVVGVFNNVTDSIYFRWHYIKDGEQYTEERWVYTGADKIDALVGTCGPELYAVKDKVFMVSTDYGKTWEQDLLEVNFDKERVPLTEITYSNQVSLSDASLRIITVIGIPSETSSDLSAAVWNKAIRVDSNGDALQMDPWTQTESDDVDNVYKLDNLLGLSTCDYNSDWLMAIGADADGKYNEILMSYLGDNGMTWGEMTGLRLPVTEDGAGKDTYKPLKQPALLMSDDVGYFYIINPADGRVYRGKYNEIFWQNDPRVVSKSSISKSKRVNSRFK